MNKQELIAAVAASTGQARDEAGRLVEAVFQTIGDNLRAGAEVRIVGFGTFSVGRRKASTGRNPRTGAPMSIESSAQPKFRPGKVLKSLVN